MPGQTGSFFFIFPRLPFMVLRWDLRSHNRMIQQSYVSRQGNYHPLRQLMLNLMSIDRMLKEP